MRQYKAGWSDRRFLTVVGVGLIVYALVWLAALAAVLLLVKVILL